MKEIYSKSGVKAKRLGNVEGGPNRKASLKDIENPAEIGWTVEEKHAKLTAKQKKLNQVREKQLKEEMSKGPSSSTDGDLGLLRSGADYRPPGDDVLAAGAYTGQSSWDADADVGEDADDSDDYDYRTSGGYFASKKVAPVGGARGTKSKPRKLSSFRDPNNVGTCRTCGLLGVVE